MDNFKRRNHRHQRRALDGFIPAGRNPEHRGIGGFEQYRANARQPGRELGNFQRTDGFHKAEQPVIAAQDLQQSEAGSIAVPAIESHRRSRWHRKRGSKRAGFLSRLRRKQRKKLSRKQLLLRSSATLVAMVLLVGGFLFVQGYLNARKIFKGGSSAAALDENVDPTRLNGEGDGRVNILLLGKGGEGHTAPDLTDTLVLASIDPIAKEAALLSIPRDLYVKTEDHGSMKINSVYATAKNSVLNGRRRDNQAEEAEKAGLTAVKAAVEDSMGVPVHYYTMVDFEAFRRAIDTVGGITINVPERLYDASVAWENNWNPVIAEKGMQTFDGKRALLYARSRHGSARGDFDRAERQRLVLLALKDKVLSTGTYSNPIRISQLLDAFGDHVRTDLGLNEVMRLYEIGREIDSSKVASIGLADPPNDFVMTANVGGLSVVMPKAGNGNFKEIHHYVRNNLKDGFIKNENASIIILNGTNRSGLATKKADELKSYGYNVTEVGDAPADNYQQTMLIDLRGGSKKYTRNYLEKRLGVSARETLPDSAINAGNADFVIILGASEE